MVISFKICTKLEEKELCISTYNINIDLIKILHTKHAQLND